MVDRLFSDASLAALYDAFCADRADFGFYLPLVMSSKSVLDVGCGTGALLHLAREAGHTGRLCGIDSANGMLEQARKRPDIDWVLGDLASARWECEFDLVVMTGHAFQVFIDDKEVHASLTKIRSALTENGRFAFETRNPLVREWEAWTLDNALEIVDRTGASVRFARAVDTPVDGNTVSFTSIFSSPSWDRPQFSRSTLRFVDLDLLSRLLAKADFLIEAQFGDWDRSPSYISNLLSVGKCESVVATHIAADIGHRNVFVLPGTSTYAENRLKRAGFVTRKCHKNQDRGRN